MTRPWRYRLARTARPGAARSSQAVRTSSERRGLERLREQRRAAQVLEPYGQRRGPSVDVDLAEELHARERRVVLPRRHLLEHDLRTERVVRQVRAERAGVQRARDELL